MNRTTALSEPGKPMSHRLLTVHTLTALPWHNLNRDENGAPKQVTEGGVTRARLSSQSLKRAARVGFERDREQAEASVRTKVAVQVIVDRVIELRGDIPKAELTKLKTAVNTRVKELTHAEGSKSTKETTVWLSAGEVEQVAQSFARSTTGEPIVTATSTDSLAIAAFGRMFAAAPGLAVASAVSVGDAVTTHAAAIELDWFTSVDDAETTHSGAAQLGFSSRTTGVYYRSFTIDRAQLARNWDLDLTSTEAEEQLRLFVRHLTLALPGGNNAGTAAQTLPAFVFAEEQAHRVAYDFHEPVTANDGGFLTPSIDALQAKASGARAFDPTLFGRTFTTGTAAPTPDGHFAEYTDFVLEYLRAA